jgi:hypothetical protein
MYKAGDPFNSASVMIPWFMAHREVNQKLLGDDYWPYGLEPNRYVLEMFLRYHYEQGILKRKLKIEDLFAPETLKWARSMPARALRPGLPYFN